MKRRTLAGVFLILITTFLAGCGGGSDGAAPVGTSGIAVDPYITDAQFQEIHEDGTLGQRSNLSDDSGRFSFAEPLSAGSQVVMVTQGMHNGVLYEGSLKSRTELMDGELIVSPFTTVLANLIESGLTKAEAKDELLKMLEAAGHDPLLLDAADLTSDPMAGVSDGGSLEALRAAMAVNGWLQAMDKVNEDGFYMTDPENYLSHLQGRQQLLSDMSAIMDNYLGEANIGALRDSLGLGLPEGYPLAIDDMIRAAVTTCNGLSDRAYLDLDDSVVMPSVEAGSYEEAFMRHYALRNMDDSGFSQWYQNTSLPEITSGFTMDDIHADMLGGNMMGGLIQDSSWGMGGSWGMMY